IKVNVHYVSTMDGAQLLPLMESLNPATTLLVLASKSFTTADTQFNVRTALAWLSHALEVGEATVCRYQLIGVSSKPEKMTDFGIPESQQLVFKEWIGGRFSLWSPIGISVAMQLGLECFDALLEGAHAMDKHFLETPLESNLPTLMALVGAWNSQFLNIPTHAVLPYDGRLKSLAAYLQQLEMESNGKSVGLDGRSVSHATCPILWGDVGPNGQHAFYQLLHQGSHTVSADFVAVTQRPVAACEKVSCALEAQEQLTLAHCLAQSQLFALGDDAIPQALRGYMAQGYRGNQPNSVVLLKTLNAWSMGALLALYEHKVFVQSVLWNLNPFDQPGVELGKRLATSLYQTLADEPVEHQNVEDPSTTQLLHKVNEWRKQRNDKGSS
ncbi:MAG: glucose-6-phosphate isomerase, partial [Halomonas sp.]